MAEAIFALDVGTRKVAGLVLAQGKKGYHIQAAAVVEHQQRAMLDGQIHDIPQVALAIQDVKGQLEKKLHISLKEAAVAAAGRALKTWRASATSQLSPAQEIAPQAVLALEAAAVQEAEKLLLEASEQPLAYHCVGYSVVGYNLDGHPIGNLVGQRGQSMTAEVIATFLPRVVVDSLVTALERAGLAMHSLTLEPIAASAVAVPAAMRGLNLALVDIGAGTSDIAITGQGTISGYAMVPSAGDEITEALASALILDFNTAERVKRQLSTRENLTFTDVVGQRHTLAAAELMEIIKPAVTELARQVATQIILLNGKPPQAVLLIGGGSLTPGLAAALAGQLEISPERVAVRGREVLNGISGAKNLQGPQAITPIGIAITALKREGLGLARVIVNGRPVHFLAGQQMTVTQALLAAGIPARHLYGRPGRGLGVEVNGRLTFLRGQPGEPGKILVNDAPATLETVLKAGDSIIVTPGRDGADARGTVGDLVPELAPKTITFNGRRITLEPEITMNGNRVDYRTPVQDQARITYNPLDTVARVLEYLGEPLDGPVLLNGQQVRPEAPIKDGDNLVTGAGAAGRNINITINGRPATLRVQGGDVLFADVFNYLDFPSSPPPGRKTLVMEVNGRPAEFTTPLAEGDAVTLRWDP
ncbi:cell division protein FtsA [Moorella thermoacetica]|uniref:Cell division protein FtsA n=1 Tax=Neomoorella thermoacetica TaxID=1525 RepID=A0A1J5JRF1_NEOTH|nr:cell division FtsA domain-containing protein [Moorella thermoacetica]OIQ09291.1 cell division protein FtsA [Moorella thermoacetica]